MSTESCTIDVWTIDLEAERGRVSEMLDLLDGGERVRAARMRTTDLRVGFVVAHGALRTILARYAAASPAALAFASTPTGKPILPGVPLAFNLSHSDGLAVCAVSRGGSVGVDVERVRRVPDADAIAGRYFAPGELREYAALPRGRRQAAFFVIWTRKEAVVKATGEGLRCPLDSFEVGATPSDAEVRIGAPAGFGDWYVRSFYPAGGYIAAVASDRPIDGLEHFEFSDITRG